MNNFTINLFNKEKPFYPLIMHYLVQLIGFKELALRGLVGSLSLEEIVSRLLALTQSLKDDPAVIDVRKSLKKLSGPLELRSEVQNDHIEINIDEFSKDLQSNINYLATSVTSANSLLILAHEISKNAEWHHPDQLWEFLRHCRNAAAHGGRFNFRNNEPR